MYESFEPSHTIRYALEKAKELDKDRAEDFSTLVHFLIENQESAPTLRKKPKPTIGSVEWVDALFDRYKRGLSRRNLPVPGTVADPALGIVLSEAYAVDQSIVEALVEGHRFAMVAENVVGDFLERYIASSLEVGEWVWAAGEIVKSVDFVRKTPGADAEWETLQIKNRDNSENSSSSAIRNGTRIQKWHRTIARSGKTLWHNFPVNEPGERLSEKGFIEFIVEEIGKHGAPKWTPNFEMYLPRPDDTAGSGMSADSQFEISENGFSSLQKRPIQSD